MADRLPPPPIAPALAARLFPTLTPAQIARIAVHGQRRQVRPGEVLFDIGDGAVGFFVVVSGAVDMVRPTGSGEMLIVTHGPGSFGGESNMISGRPSLVRAEVSEAGEVIELDHAELLALVQTDAELSEILMRVFILRRVELIAQGFGDAVLLGSEHCSDTMRIKEFLTRNGHPYAYIDLDRDSDAQELIDRFAITEDDVPVVICRGETVLRNPTSQQIAECLGFNDSIDETHVRDVVIVGAGPAGLSAAVYGASEGLDVLVLDVSAPGGQAGSSSRIENYLGFPTGISGQELAARAYAQAQKFGAEILIAKSATHLACDGQPYAVHLADGPRIRARAVIIATGADYRKPALPGLAQFQGAGVFYAATPMEAQTCVGEDLVVVGGGNSAGQAAVFLAQTARRVYMLVRSEGLAETMSRYLVRRIEENPAIELRTQTELVALEGDGQLERVRWRDRRAGVEETHDVRHVFIMTGAVPNTGWLDRCVVLDEKGFIKTGPSLTPEDLAAAGWPLARPPYLLETTLPGVFAVGDVRGGNIKRVASAVGEGSNAISFVHQVLRQ
ncbi:MAG TPA: FAD-dependent oxidoreductase [Thermoanaerobaculia bacterium]|nr:FAD-dependent oxidoreductase [Thermoanaerobaculia bacterium]